MIRLDRVWLIGTALAVVVALLTPALVSAQPILIGQPGADPRGVQIKAALEKMGYKVYDVGFQAAKGNNPAAWFALTVANYAALTTPNAVEQGSNIWVGISGVIGADNAVLVGGQVWNKYVIQMTQTNAKVREFLTAWNAAKSNAEKSNALKIVLGKFRLAVFDLEKNQYVDVKDFVNKNFTD